MAERVVVFNHFGELLLGYTANGIVCMNFMSYIRRMFEAHRSQTLSWYKIDVYDVIVTLW